MQRRNCAEILTKRIDAGNETRNEGIHWGFSMPITEMEYVCVSQRAAEMGCVLPQIAIMPDNFAVARSQRELRIRREALALRRVLERSSFPLGTFCHAAEQATYSEEDFVHWEASLFVSAAILKREPYAVPLALSIIRHHLAEYLSDDRERPIRLAMVVERNGGRACTRLVYEGNIAGLRALAERVSAIAEQ